MATIITKLKEKVERKQELIKAHERQEIFFSLMGNAVTC